MFFNRSPKGVDDYKAFSEAADLVSQRWGQGDMTDGRNYCLVGAVGKSRKMRVWRELLLSKRDIKLIEKRLRFKPDYWVPRIFFVALVPAGMTAMTAWITSDDMYAALVGVPLFVCCWGIGSLTRNRQLWIELWNDAPWRERDDVIKVLQKVADEFRPAWLEGEVLRLSIECSNLRLEIKQLKERLVLAEAENQRLWRSTLSVQSTEADERQLAELERELAEKAARMERLEVAA